MSQEKVNSTPKLEKEEEKIIPQPIEKKSEAQPNFGHSAKAEDYALRLSTKLDQSGINIERFNISINGQSVFGMKNGDIDQSKTNISDKQAEQIKEALNDPSSFDGSMKITKGEQTLLHIKDGKVLIDKARLVEDSAKLDLDIPDPQAKKMYEKYSQDVKSKGLDKTRQVAKNALQDGVSFEDVADMLKSQDKGYEALKTINNELTANKSLNRIITSAKAQAKLSSNKSKQQEVKQEKAPTLSA